ncbi:restriction endonuclease subunit M [Ornithinimicrobium cerasi]|uniref:N-6 DNA Methylase n=1 Tax=Ornithinimicrobium cerasi TaxID=2248773 RepID=A0A285VAJ9_9MICO|nr:restriction endonuclease subunit M [Ornithinimicrobium cerasi]SOC51145.1 hypothetical protein SAMN05421879_10147 [Ornithinimicrobium cerasi]
MSLKQAETLVKSKHRVVAHGEVFTPGWLIQDMVDLVGDECARIESRVLEPACGAGNFLSAVLLRKLASVELRHGRSKFEKRHYALLALMSVYGIELLPDNADECRGNLTQVYTTFLEVDPDSEWAQAARAVLRANVLRGDAVNMTVPGNGPLIFPEWGYLGMGKYQRRDFRYSTLTRRASFTSTQAGGADHRDLFTPVQTYPRMTVRDIAKEAAE